MNTNLLLWFKESLLLKHHTIAEEDLSIISIVDTPEEALKIVKTAPHIKYF